MKSKIPVLGIASLALASLGLGFWLVFTLKIPAFSFLDHSFQPNLGLFLASSGLLALTLFTFWLLYSQVLSRFFSKPFPSVLKSDSFTYIPLAFSALAPATLFHYVSAADILARARLLLAASVFLVVYIKIVQFRAWRKEKPEVRGDRLIDLTRFSSRKKLAVFFVVFLLISNLASFLMVREGISFSGDEPHYLLITHSLWRDRDLDLANNYARQDYNAYMRESVTIPQLHVIPGRKEGSQYSFHSPGTAFVMLPFYAIGSAFGKTGLILWLRFGMSLFGALFGLQVFLFARKILGDEGKALMIWALTSFATPIFFFAIHIYPEIIIAFFSLLIFGFLKEPASLTRNRLLLCGFLLSTFIWFHALKYIFISGPLLLYAVWVLKKKHSAARDFVSFLAFPVVVSAIYFVFQKGFYGSFSLTAISVKGSLEGGKTLTFAKELFTNIPFRYRWETLADYFFDQRDGLLFYAPIYFFSFLGFAEMARKKAGDFMTLLFLASPYILVQAFLTQRGSYSPQARPLMAVIWAMIIGLDYFVAYNREKTYSALFVLSSGISLLFTAILIKNPLALYQETTVGVKEAGGRLFDLLSNLHFHLTRWLPSYIKSREGGWPPNIFWLVIFLAFILIYLKARPSNPGGLLPFRAHVAIVAIGGAIFFFWFILYPRTPLFSPVNVSFPTGERITFYSMSRVARAVEPGKFLLPEDDRAYVFSFTSRRKIKDFRFEFGSLAGNYEIGLNYFDAPLFEGQTNREMRTIDARALPAYKFKGSNLYIVTIRLTKKSDVQTAENPYLFKIEPSE